MNKVLLVGRITKDPEIRYLQNGTPQVLFTLAVDRGFGDNKVTDFLTCVAWEQRAEFISKYFAKGSEIRILGEINTRKWQDQNGNNRTAFHHAPPLQHSIKNILGYYRDRRENSQEKSRIFKDFTQLPKKFDWAWTFFISYCKLKRKSKHKERHPKWIF